MSRHVRVGRAVGLRDVNPTDFSFSLGVRASCPLLKQAGSLRSQTTILVAARVPSQINLRVRLSRRQGIQPRQAQVTRAVAIIDRRFLTFDDGEGGIDVAHVIAVGDAVQMEEHCVEFGPQDAGMFPPTRLFLPAASLVRRIGRRFCRRQLAGRRLIAPPYI